jgi:hypothetical protein
MLRYASIHTNLDAYVQAVEQSVLDALNSPFIAGKDFYTGNEFSSSTTIDTTHTSTPTPAAVHQICRWASSFTYSIPGLTPGATYGVRLHFA